MARKKISIIGAGISGLALAWYLEKHEDVTIFEAKTRVGGWMQPMSGPRSLRTQGSGRHILELVDALGIQDEVIETKNHKKAKYLVCQGLFKKVPSSLFSLLFSSCGRKLLLGCIREVFSSRNMPEDESVLDFFSRCCGKEVATTFIDPLIAGIYAADPKALSMQAAFPELVELKRRYGSFVVGSLLSSKKEKGSRIVFKEGIDFLPKKLASKLSATLHLNCPVRAIHEEGEKVILETERGLFESEKLFCAISPPALANLLPSGDVLREYLLQIPMTSVVVVTVHVAEGVEFDKIFGFLCASHEERSLLGVIYESENQLSFMLGGQRDPEAIYRSDEELIVESEKVAKKYLRLYKPFISATVVRAKEAIACYPVGYNKLLQKIEQELENRRISVVGSGFYGVSVGDCIASAKSQATRLT